MLPRLLWPGDQEADHGAPILWNFVERDHPWLGVVLRQGGIGASPLVDVILDVAYHDSRRPTLAIRLDTRRGPVSLRAARAAFATWCEERGYTPVPSTLELLP